MDYPTSAILIGLASSYIAATVVAGLLAKAGFPLPWAGKRIGCIDGLRGYLALSVLAHHFIIWVQVTRLGGTWSPPSVHVFNQLGTGSVALFFMTTGFVFYPRVLAGLRACAWPAIYATRLFRIVPLVALSVALVTALIALRTGHGLDRGYWAAAAQWITTWSEPPLLGFPDSGRLNAYVLWSLWYEWLFYLFALPVCALAMDLIRGRLPTWVVPATLLTAAVIARVLDLFGSILVYLPLFAIGMLAYELQLREHIARVIRGPAMSIVAALALAVGMMVAQTPYGWAMPLFAVLFVAVACGNSLGGLLRTKGALVLGECSYGIYLLHGILLSLLFVEAAPWMGTLPTGIVPLLLPVAAIVVTLTTPVTYLALERPAIRVGSRLAGLWSNRPFRPETAELEVAP